MLVIKHKIYRVELDHSKIYPKKKKKRKVNLEEEDDWVLTIKGTKNLDDSSFYINLCQKTITCDASLSLSLSKLSSSQLVAGWRPAVFSTNLAIQATGGSIQTSKTTTLHLYNRRDRDNLTLNRPNYKAASAHDLASWDIIAKRQNSDETTGK